MKPHTLSLDLQVLEQIDELPNYSRERKRRINDYIINFSKKVIPILKQYPKSHFLMSDLDYDIFEERFKKRVLDYISEQLSMPIIIERKATEILYTEGSGDDLTAVFTDCEFVFVNRYSLIYEK